MSHMARFWTSMAKKNKYDSYSDRDLVDAILSGNEEAAIYLIYNKYYRDLRYLCKDYCGSHEYIDDVCHEVYLMLKGNNGDWHPLSTWDELATLRTWLNKTVRNYFYRNRDFLIGLREKKLYSEKEDEPDPVENVESHYPSIEANMQKVLLLEAINKLKNTDQKLVILKEIQGYSHEEIAAILNQVRREENRIKIGRDGNEILADAAAVDVLKQRAVAQLRETLGAK